MDLDMRTSSDGDDDTEEDGGDDEDRLCIAKGLIGWLVGLVWLVGGSQVTENQIL